MTESTVEINQEVKENEPKIGSFEEVVNLPISEHKVTFKNTLTPGERRELRAHGGRFRMNEGENSVLIDTHAMYEGLQKKVLFVIKEITNSDGKKLPVSFDFLGSLEDQDFEILRDNMYALEALYEKPAKK